MKRGVYVYERSKIDEAHVWNQRRTFEKMLRGYSPLLIDNTNVKLWEMQPYARMAAQCGYKIFVLDANTKWNTKCNELAKKNSHNVPKAQIQQMLTRFENNITPEALLLSCNLPLDYQKNPQQRNYPPVAKAADFVCSVSSPSTSSVHNHNSMNLDLKLPDSRPNPERKTSTNNSQCEVSTLIEISDDEDNARSITKPIQVKYFPPEKIDLSSWGVDENVLNNLNMAVKLPYKSGNHTIGISTNSEPETKPQTSEQGCNTTLADFHKESEGARVIYGKNCSINANHVRLPQNKAGMFDKSCCTQDDTISDRDEDLNRLMDIFPNIPVLYVRDMYDDCKGDFELTFEIFLEDNKDYSNMVRNNTDNDYNQSKKAKMGDDVDIASSSTTFDLIDISGSPYEEIHLPNTTKPETNDIISSSWELPSSSKETFSSNTNQTPFDDPIMLLDSDSDLEFDNLCPSRAQSETNSEDNDIIELNLGAGLIEQLEKEFGDPQNDYPKGFQPVVQVPKAFARQLYASYVESVYQQMETQKSVLDKLVIEDEAFARKLYEEENGLVKEAPPAGLKEIMNEQVAMNIQEREISVWRNCTPNDLALQLTLKKLYASFPTIDREVLFEIFHANKQDYKQTVEDLLVSVDVKETTSITDIREPPISQSMLEELEEVNEEYNKANDETEDNRSSESFREEANDYLKKRTALYQKAQEYYSQGQREVAQFYSELAKKQTQFYDMANNRAATVLLEEHSKRLQNFDTLDLHFLFVKEAIPALDVFIDRNINLLKGGTKKSQSLLVITGRGNRSKNGVSKIKPAVISRLKTRKIQFAQVNPGLLKIKVNLNSIMTSDL
ncbi:hypothetical protein HHI36_016338 [Cryptolaemus montrouzieri]